MTISNERRHQLKWELIDCMFSKVVNEFAVGYSTLGELSDNEREYLQKMIRTMAKSVRVDDHFLL